MYINALYLNSFPPSDTSTNKWRLSVKTSGSENIFSTLFVFQLNPADLPPLQSNPSNYMTLFHAGTSSNSGSGVFLKYNSSTSKYEIGLRYNIKNGSIWTEIPGSFTPLISWGNINDPYLVLFNYNVTSKTTPTFTFAIVNFLTSPDKTSPDFSVSYTFSSTEITATGQWGFGSIPMTITSQYGLTTNNNYNSYVSAGIYLTYLQAWPAIQIPINSISSTAYAMFNTNVSYSLYSLMRSNQYVPSGTTSFNFQMVTSGGTLSSINNNAISSISPTSVTLTSGSTAFSALPGFGINGSDSGSTYITSVQNAISCIIKGTKILTETGYKLIENLSQDDKLIDKDGKSINIVKIYNFHTIPNNETNPILIKKGEYGSFEDLYISKGHAIYLDGEFVWPFKLNLPQVENSNYEPICYFHIETENYLKDTIIANGVIIETYCAKENYFLQHVPKYINKNGNRIMPDSKEK